MMYLFTLNSFIQLTLRVRRPGERRGSFNDGTRTGAGLALTLTLSYAHDDRAELGLTPSLTLSLLTLTLSACDEGVLAGAGLT